MSHIIRRARQRIREERRREVEVTVTREGKPVENAQVSLMMRQHEFLFGCNCFPATTYETKEENDRYTALFTNLLNYGTLPFYWGRYEPRQHCYNEPELSNQVKWARDRWIRTKGHPLIWHEVVPEWLTDEQDVGALEVERVRDIMSKYAYLVDFWDLNNETTVNNRFDNPITRWSDKIGAMNMMKLIGNVAREVNPGVKLLYNDFNVHGDDFYRFLRQMREEDVQVYGIGIQSHMHQYRWSFEETMEIMDRAAEFGWPLHFTECTVISGSCANEDGKVHFDNTPNQWDEPEELLYSQAEYVRDFYTLVYSHPATEALTWWDFCDHAWLGAPCGLVNDHLNPKPVYYELEKLIRGEWWSNVELLTGTQGNCRTKVYCGSYDVEVMIDGRRTIIRQEIPRAAEPLRIEIHI